MNVTTATHPGRGSGHEALRPSLGPPPVVPPWQQGLHPGGREPQQLRHHGPVVVIYHLLVLGRGATVRSNDTGAWGRPRGLGRLRWDGHLPPSRSAATIIVVTDVVHGAMVAVGGIYLHGMDG